MKTLKDFQKQTLHEGPKLKAAKDIGGIGFDIAGAVRSNTGDYDAKQNARAVVNDVAATRGAQAIQGSRLAKVDPIAAKATSGALRGISMGNRLLGVHDSLQAVSRLGSRVLPRVGEYAAPALRIGSRIGKFAAGKVPWVAAGLAANDAYSGYNDAPANASTLDKALNAGKNVASGFTLGASEWIPGMEVQHRRNKVQEGVTLNKTLRMFREEASHLEEGKVESLVKAYKWLTGAEKVAAKASKPQLKVVASGGKAVEQAQPGIISRGWQSAKNVASTTGKVADTTAVAADLGAHIFAPDSQITPYLDYYVGGRLSRRAFNAGVSKLASKIPPASSIPSKLIRGTSSAVFGGAIPYGVASGMGSRAMDRIQNDRSQGSAPTRTDLKRAGAAAGFAPGWSALDYMTR